MSCMYCMGDCSQCDNKPISEEDWGALGELADREFDSRGEE